MTTSLTLLYLSVGLVLALPSPDAFKVTETTTEIADHDAKLLREYRTYNGLLNNPTNPPQGMAESFFTRDGMSIGTAYTNPSVPAATIPKRTLSNMLHRGQPNGGIEIFFGGWPIPKTDTPATTVGANAWRSFFGQFVSHDVQQIATGSQFGAPHIEFLEPTDVLYIRPCDVGEVESPLCFDPTISANHPLAAFGLPGPGEPGAPGPNFLVVSPALKIPQGETNFDVLNHVTSFLDLSTVYGSSDAVVATLRANYDTDGSKMSGGKLYTTSHTWDTIPGITVDTYDELPPSLAQVGYTTQEELQGFINPKDVFITGDRRFNSNGGVASHGIAWMRHHNRLADELAAAHPTWDTDTLFEEARRLNIAIYQHIVMDEYLPAVLGDEIVVPAFTGYNPSVDATTSVAFNTGLRYGHSVIEAFRSVDSKYCTIFGQRLDGGLDESIVGFLGGPAGFISILAAIGLNDVALREVIRGLSVSNAAHADLKVHEFLRSIAFPPASFGFPRIAGRGVDLAQIDLIRTVEAGASNYIDLRNRFWAGASNERDIYGRNGCVDSPGQDDIVCFLLLTGGDGALSALFQGIFLKVSQIHPLVGMLAEPIVEPSSLGGTMSGIVLAEYVRKRDGDRFWYENQFSDAEVAAIKKISYLDVLKKVGMADTKFQRNVFSMPPGRSRMCPQQQAH